MTHRPFDPGELDEPSADAERAAGELGRYLGDTATGAPRGFEQRVMAAIEQEPAHRRGFLASLLAPTGGGGLRRLARAGVLAVTLVIAVGGAILAGNLVGLIREVGSGSPTPTESVSPAPSESLLPSPTISVEPSPTGLPEGSEDVHSQPPGSTASPDASENETPDASPEETPEDSKSPTPSPTAKP